MRTANYLLPCEKAVTLAEREKLIKCETNGNVAWVQFTVKLVVVSFVLCLLVSTAHAGESHYVTTPPDVVVAMLDSVDVTADDTVVDLGCGDGRIPVIAALRYGASAIGVEYDPAIAALAKANVKRNNVSHLVTIRHGDALRTRWTDTPTVVTVYLDGELLAKLRPVLEKLPVGSRVVSHQHAVPGWPHVRAVAVRGHRLLRYRVVESIARERVCGPQGCRYVDGSGKMVEGYR